MNSLKPFSIPQIIFQYPYLASVSARFSACTDETSIQKEICTKSGLAQELLALSIWHNRKVSFFQDNLVLAILF